MLHIHAQTKYSRQLILFRTNYLNITATRDIFNFFKGCGSTVKLATADLQLINWRFDTAISDYPEGQYLAELY